MHIVLVRLPFYRTPRSDTHVVSSTSSSGVTSTLLIHLLNKPSCPIVCLVTVSSTTEYQSNNNIDTGVGPSADPDRSRGRFGRGGSLDAFAAHRSSRNWKPFGCRVCNTNLNNSSLRTNGCTRSAYTRRHVRRAGLGPLPARRDTSRLFRSVNLVRLRPPPQAQCRRSRIDLPQTQHHFPPLMYSTLSTSLSSPALSSLAGANG